MKHPLLSLFLRELPAHGRRARKDPDDWRQMFACPRPLTVRLFAGLAILVTRPQIALLYTVISLLEEVTLGDIKKLMGEIIHLHRKNFGLLDEIVIGHQCRNGVLRGFCRRNSRGFIRAARGVCR